MKSSQSVLKPKLRRRRQRPSRMRCAVCTPSSITQRRMPLATLCKRNPMRLSVRSFSAIWREFAKTSQFLIPMPAQSDQSCQKSQNIALALPKLARLPTSMEAVFQRSRSRRLSNLGPSSVKSRESMSKMKLISLWPRMSASNSAWKKIFSKPTMLFA